MPTTSASAPTVVDVRSQRVLVARSETQTGTRTQNTSYIHAFLSLFYDPNSNTAFSTLRISVVPEENVFVYLHLRPEHITSLSFDLSNAQTQDLARLCGSSARGSISLHYTLDTPGAIIGPPEWPLPDGKVGKDVLDDLQLLAVQTDLVLHVPNGVIVTPHLRSLCHAASTGGRLRSSAPHASLKGLFGSRGGKAVQLLDEATQDFEALAAPPPAYDNVAGPCRVPLELNDHPSPFKKRRRESSGTSTASPTPEPESEKELRVNLAAVERNEHLRDQMRSYFQEMFNVSMGQHEKRILESMTKREADFRKAIFAELNNMETRMMTAVSEQVERLTYSVTDEVLDKLHEKINEGVSRDELDEAIDDKVTGIKWDMEDFVKDEMIVAQDKILDHFESGIFYSRFRRSEDE